MTSGRPDSDLGSPAPARGQEGATPAPPNLVERLALWLGCLCAVVLFGLALADIVLRAASVEFFVAGEANGILMAWMIFLALPHVTRTGSHLSLDFFDRKAPPWLRAGVRILGYLVMLAYVAVLSWYCGKLTWSSYINEVRSSTILRWPVIYAQLGVMLGLVLLAVTQVLILVADVRSGGRVHPPKGASAP